MKMTLSGLCMLLLIAGSAHAQLYKWVGPDGKVTYSDTPPPKNAAKVEKKNIAGSDGVDTGSLPYALAEAVKSNPVTLYTSANCPPCDSGRSHLNKRGIPFKEKTVASNGDIAKLREAGGGDRLPFLMIGRNKQNGFEAVAWDAALTGAGYPASNQLPKTYSNPKAESAAPAAPKPANNAAAARSDSPADSPPPPAGNAPPGFRF